jgi:hypothetical protein
MDPFRQVVSAEEVDPDWLNSALDHAAFALGWHVLGVRAEAIGSGQVGDTVRYHLDWERDSSLGGRGITGGDLSRGGGPPSSVIAKVPAADGATRAAAAQVETYVKEVGFYRDLAASVTVRVPAVYHCGWEPEAQEFVLVMEDLAPARPGDQLRGGTVQMAAAAVDEIAGLHGPTWGVEDTWPAWLRAPTPESQGMLHGLFAMLAPGFLDRYRGRMPDTYLHAVERLVDRIGTWGELVQEWGDRNGWCAIHNDYRLDNLLFADAVGHDDGGDNGADGGAVGVRPQRAMVVDWQTVTGGIGPFDVAYYLSSGLDRKLRLANEQWLIDRYSAALRRNGVEVGSAVVDGYRLGSATGLIMATIASQLVARTDRGDEMFAIMASGSIDQMSDCGLWALLDP